MSAGTRQQAEQHPTASFLGRTLQVLDAFTLSQLCYRVLRSPRRRLAIHSARRATSCSLQSIPWITPWVESPATEVTGNRVTIHGHTSSIIPDATWESAELTMLARFHLHYLDWLGAPALTPEQRTRALDTWTQRYPVGRPVAWAPYVVATRLMAIVKLADQLSDNGFDAGLSIAQHAAFLSASVERDIGGNHLLRNGAALYVAGSAMTGPDAARVRRVGRTVLDQCVRSQILPDGGHIERSSWYHILVLSDLLDAIEAAVGTGTPDGSRWADECRTMVDWLYKVAGSGFRMPLFGDGAEDASRVATLLLERVERLGLSRASTSLPSVNLPHTGWHRAELESFTFMANLRLTGDKTLRGHTHGDVGTFEFWDSDGPIIVDQGTVTYAEGDDRSMARATRSHNTLTIDDRDQVDFWGAFRVGNWIEPEVETSMPTNGGHEVCVAHDGFSRLDGSPRHVRRFAYGPGRPGLIIRDAVDLVTDLSSDRPALTVTRRIRFTGGVHVEARGPELIVTRDGVRLRITAEADWKLEEAEWWPAWGTRRGATIARLDTEIRSSWSGQVAIEW